MKHSIRKTALLCGAALLASPVLAADVTPDRLANTPELRDQRHALVLFVFGL